MHRTDTHWNLKRRIPQVSSLPIVAKFGSHVLRCLASRLANVIRQIVVGREADLKPSFSDF